MLQCGFVRSNFAFAITLSFVLHFRVRGLLNSFSNWPANRSPLSGRRLERVKGIEPSSSAWKAVALPLSYTRLIPLPSFSVTRLDFGLGVAACRAAALR